MQVDISPGFSLLKRKRTWLGFESLHNWDKIQTNKQTNKQLTFDVDLARGRETDGVVHVTIVNSIRRWRPVDSQNTLQAHVDNVLAQRSVVPHPRKIDQFRIGLGFAHQPRLAFHFAQSDRTLGFD